MLLMLPVPRLCSVCPLTCNNRTSFCIQNDATWLSMYWREYANVCIISIVNSFVWFSMNGFLMASSLSCCAGVGWLDGWLFNGTSTQNLCQLRGWKPAQSTNDGLTLHDNNVTQFTIKHFSYISATIGYLVE